MFKGHMLFGLHEVLPQPATYITVLRDPVERVLSAYYYMRTYKLHPFYWKLRKQKWSLEDYVERTRRDNVQCKIIAGADYHGPSTEKIFETAKEHMNRYFSVVGLSERFEESLALMKLRFGWRLNSYSAFNVTRSRPKKGDLSQSTLDLIVQRNSFDMELYRLGVQRFEADLAKVADKVGIIVDELKAARSRAEGPLNSALLSLRAEVRKAINRAYSAI
jgi:hypothetical protein